MLTAQVLVLPNCRANNCMWQPLGSYEIPRIL